MESAKYWVEPFTWIAMLRLIKEKVFSSEWLSSRCRRERASMAKRLARGGARVNAHSALVKHLKTSGLQKRGETSNGL